MFQTAWVVRHSVGFDPIRMKKIFLSFPLLNTVTFIWRFGQFMHGLRPTDRPTVYESTAYIW